MSALSHLSRRRGQVCWRGRLSGAGGDRGATGTQELAPGASVARVGFGGCVLGAHVAPWVVHRLWALPCCCPLGPLTVFTDPYQKRPGFWPVFSEWQAAPDFLHLRVVKRLHGVVALACLPWGRSCPEEHSPQTGSGGSGVPSLRFSAEMWPSEQGRFHGDHPPPLNLKGRRQHIGPSEALGCLA